MSCPDPLLVHAYCDGELDAATAIGVEQHLGDCSRCEALRREIESIRAAMRSSATYHRLGERRRLALLRELRAAGPSGPAARPPPFWAGAIAGLAAGIGAFALALTLRPAAPVAGSALVRDLVAAHVRALISDRAIDVASTDRHTVKPWFAGRVEVSPPVADFADQGYALVGGRVDYVDSRRTATTVYRHGAHLISVFAWPAGALTMPAAPGSEHGYQVACWHARSIDSCAVADAAGEELKPLARLLQALADPARE
jgi:anti-sigma factor RsiW